MKKNFRYIFGPVPSWRLGASLGADPLSTRGKTCNFDCIYCQIGKTVNLTTKRKIFAHKSGIFKELKSLPKKAKIDYITFSGMGEPTLAKNIGSLIKAIKKVRKEKIAVLTNSALLWDRKVQKDLLEADFVVAKLDAHNQKTFEAVNKPVKGLKLKKVIAGIKAFRKIYKGKFALQIMFMPENKKYAGQIAEIAKTINPDEVQINTPLRPSKINPVSRRELLKIAKYFNKMNVITVYGAPKKKVKPISDRDTLRRRGKIK